MIEANAAASYVAVHRVVQTQEGESVSDAAQYIRKLCTWMRGTGLELVLAERTSAERCASDLPGGWARLTFSVPRVVYPASHRIPRLGLGIRCLLTSGEARPFTTAIVLMRRQNFRRHQDSEFWIESTKARSGWEEAWLLQPIGRHLPNEGGSPSIIRILREFEALPKRIRWNRAELDSGAFTYRDKIRAL